MGINFPEDDQSAALAAVTPPDRELDSSVVSGGKSSKAEKKRKKAMKAMRNAQFTPAQRIMRDEMGKGVHQVGELLAETFGPLRSDKERATEVAYEVINEYQGQIVTGFKEWTAIQGMVEDAYLRGLAEGIAVGESNDDLVPGPRFDQPRDDG